MANMVTAECNRLLDASLAVATFTAPTGSMKVALCTSAPTASAAGTEVSGGSYARQNVTFGAASAGATSNTGVVSFTGMPAATVTHVDIFDSNGTPRRAWFGALTASKTTASGDTLSFAVAALAISLG